MASIGIHGVLSLVLHIPLAVAFRWSLWGMHWGKHYLHQSVQFPNQRSRAMLLESNLLKSLWGYAILHAIYIKNYTYTCSILDKTPYEMVYSKKLNLHDAYECGKDVYVKIKQDDKLAHQATKAKWIGHSSQSNGHIIYWPSIHKVSVERSVIFDTGEKVKLPPTSPSDELKVSTSKKTDDCTSNCVTRPIYSCVWLA